MRRELPRDLSFAGLFAPHPEYDYFAGAARFPLRAPGDGFSWSRAWHAAEASLLAYVPDEVVVRTAWSRAGLADVAVFGAAGHHVHVASSDTVTVVAFRGTEGLDWTDWKTNLKFALRASDGAGDGRVHTGFAAAYELLAPELTSALAGRPPALLCGHSLGGALATVAAARLPAAAVASLYTFGSPRVGTGAFRDALRTPVYRIVNNSDLVTQLPPYPYRHVGERIVFDETGAAVRAPAAGARFVAALRGMRAGLDDAIRAWRAGDFGALALRSIVDHGPQRYAVLCWNELVGAEV